VTPESSYTRSPFSNRENLDEDRRCFDSLRRDLSWLLIPAARQALQHEVQGNLAHWRACQPTHADSAATGQFGIFGRISRLLGEIDETEVRAHSRQLASCLIANWLHVLVGSFELTGGTYLPLDSQGLPAERHVTTLVLCLDAFVLEDDVILALWRQFITSRATGPDEPLSSRLILTRDGTRLTACTRIAR
jgi:hypothetical protein